MEGSLTPKKASQEQEAASPSAKRALDFSFWSERKQKMPKIVEEDLQKLKVEELTLSKRVNGKVLLCCTASLELEKVSKVACHDGEKNITVIAFGEIAARLRNIKPGNKFVVSKFEVKKELPEYPTGAFQCLQIIINEWSTLEIVDDDMAPVVLDLKDISEAKTSPDSSVIDMLAVVCKNWGMAQTSNGKKKLDLSLTDRSMETIRLTFWDDKADQLVGTEGDVIAISRVLVHTFLERKVLNAQWHTHVIVNPDLPDGSELLKWYKNELETN